MTDRSMRKDPVEFLRRWHDTLQALPHGPGGLHDLVSVTSYVAVGSPKDLRTEVMDFMQNELEDTGDEAFVSIADSFREEGRQEGRARDIVTVLEARGLEISEATRSRILVCRDETDLEQWLRRAVAVGTAESIFSET